MVLHHMFHKCFWLEYIGLSRHKNRRHFSTRSNAVATFVLLSFILVFCVSFWQFPAADKKSRESQQFIMMATSLSLGGNGLDESIGVKSRANLFFGGESTTAVKNQDNVKLAKIKAESELLKKNESVVNRLEMIFQKADSNKDSKLDLQEISKWINSGVIKHFRNAIQNNFDHYHRIDLDPRDGLVTWKEYLGYFFRLKGLRHLNMTVEDVRQKTPKYKSLPKDIKVEIARSEASWSEAANSSPEYLNIDEFLSFKHPEASPSKLLSLVADIFNTFDSDGNGKISEKEFDLTFFELGTVEPILKEDFKIIDRDGNGIINRIEMMKYLDPRENHNSDRDSELLIKAGDQNSDGQLSLDEILPILSTIVKSKFYDVDANLHNHDT